MTVHPFYLRSGIRLRPNPPASLLFALSVLFGTAHPVAANDDILLPVGA